MTPFQFTLFFVALLVAIALVLVRLLRLEARFAELARLATIETKLASLVTTLERARLDPLETALREIRGDLHEISVGLERVERAVQRVQTLALAPQGVSVPVTPPVATDPERLRDLVVGRLLALGYANVRIQTDLELVVADEDAEVVVECERSGMPCKGKVLAKGGAVTEVQVQTMAPMFP